MEVTGDKPPPRVCPRCISENTKFCYYNNYRLSQPRYFCKNCRRYWTHGGALRNIPIGGSSRRAKRTRIEPPLVVSVEIQQVSQNQPFLHVQGINEFLRSFGGFASSAVVVGNHYSSLPEIHGDIVTNVTPIQTFRPMEALDFAEDSFHHDDYDVGSNDLIGNPLINQSFGESVDNHNRWSHSFNNTTNMNHNDNTSRNREAASTEMNMNRIINNCVIRSSYHLEKHGP